MKINRSWIKNGLVLVILFSMALETQAITNTPVACNNCDVTAIKDLIDAAQKVATQIINLGAKKILADCSTLAGKLWNFDFITADERKCLSDAQRKTIRDMLGKDPDFKEIWAWAGYESLWTKFLRDWATDVMKGIADAEKLVKMNLCVPANRQAVINALDAVITNLGIALNRLKQLNQHRANVESKLKPKILTEIKKMLDSSVCANNLFTPDVSSYSFQDPSLSGLIVTSCIPD